MREVGQQEERPRPAASFRGGELQAATSFSGGGGELQGRRRPDRPCPSPSPPRFRRRRLVSGDGGSIPATAAIPATCCSIPATPA